MKLLLAIICFFTISNANPLAFEQIVSDFEQTITNEENSTIKYEGTFYATSKGEALWQYKKPIEKNIYFNKNQVVIIEPELEQAIITNLENSPNLTEILKNSKKISEKLYQTSYDSITYSVEVENDTIKKISYEDKLSNKITITLINPKTDKKIEDKIFEAKIPTNYDIITQ